MHPCDMGRLDTWHDKGEQKHAHIHAQLFESTVSGFTCGSGLDQVLGSSEPLV